MPPPPSFMITASNFSNFSLTAPSCTFSFLKHLKRRALLKKRRAPLVLHPMIHTGSTKEQKKLFKLPQLTMF